MKPRHQLHQENGFVTILILGLLPILLSTLSIYYLSTTWIHMDLNAHQLCRKELLQITGSVAEDLAWLMGQNLKSTELQTEKVRLERALNVAILPWVKAAIKARLALIHMQQLTLELQQKSRIQKANADLTAGMLRAEYLVQSYLESTLKRFPFFYSVKNFKTRTQNPALQVRPTTKHLAPNYGTNPMLRQVQNQVLEWTYILQIKPWLVRYGFHDQYVFHQSCEASIDEIKGGTSWKRVLTKARY